ncbi:hypothetical protein AB0F07_40540 [Streptomyces fructofermentans]|uniref:hypothetical protein n=1 Tax=Streptomyces fructofermentans TaxID=152141 RepID=UPI0033EDF47B
MAIVVMRELREETSQDHAPGDALSRIEAMHAAMTDTSPHGLPGDETVCGKPTADMERVHYQSAGADVSWLPPSTSRWECPRCAEALQS